MVSAEDKAKHLFAEGLYCAEAVLTTIAQDQGICCDAIPGIATGLCSGMARTGGSCGAVTGGILGLGLAKGRRSPRQSVEPVYDASQELVFEFRSRFGSANCKELLGVDLGTEEGQIAFKAKNLGLRCREFTGFAAKTACELLREETEDDVACGELVAMAGQ